MSPLRSLPMVLLAGCAAAPSAPTPPPRVAPSLADMERLAQGWRAELPLARLLVPDGAAPAADGTVPLFLHFQGGVPIAEENFARMGQGGVLIASTLAGLSSTFKEPYLDPAALDGLLAAGEAALAERWGRAVRFEPVTITFFSAGYGAVREFLKHPAHFERIDALVSADSIYASVVAPDVRAPHADQMEGFLLFAQAAARGEKTFVLVHTGIVTDYASTAECADLILASVAAERAPAGWFTERGVPIGAEAHVGGFHLYTLDEGTASSHMDCLYMVPELVRRHALGAGAVGSDPAARAPR